MGRWYEFFVGVGYLDEKMPSIFAKDKEKLDLVGIGSSKDESVFCLKDRHHFLKEIDLDRSN